MWRDVCPLTWRPSSVCQVLCNSVYIDLESCLQCDCLIRSEPSIILSMLWQLNNIWNGSKVFYPASGFIVRSAMAEVECGSPWKQSRELTFRHAVDRILACVHKAHTLQPKLSKLKVKCPQKGKSCTIVFSCYIAVHLWCPRQSFIMDAYYRNIGCGKLRPQSQMHFSAVCWSPGGKVKQRSSMMSILLLATAHARCSRANLLTSHPSHRTPPFKGTCINTDVKICTVYSIHLMLAAFLRLKYVKKVCLSIFKWVLILTNDTTQQSKTKVSALNSLLIQSQIPLFTFYY